jgi:UDP-glucose 4-epimerase
MDILVTGGAGFIGSHVVDTLIQEGHRVIVVDDLSHGHRENLHPDVVFYQVDIRSQELQTVFERERPEVVSHHAAQIDVGQSVRDPIYDAETNVLGTLNVLECCRANGTRKVIFISSAAVYGEPRHLPCDEGHPIHPLSPYGASKYAIEVYLRTYRSTYDLDTTVLRYGNVYGPRQDPHGEAGVVAIFANRMLAGKAPRINGTGEQARDFVYVGDCARANRLALTRGAGGVFNISTGRGVTINQLYETLKDLTPYEGSAQYGPEKPGEIFKITLDASRAAETLGWKPSVGLEDGLAQTVAYFRDRQESRT